MKRWYTIRAPRHPWDFKRIGETIGESDEHIIGRVYEMTQQNLMETFSRCVVMRFRVLNVLVKALTTFIGHHHQTDHTAGKSAATVARLTMWLMVTTDGYLVQ